MDEPEPSRVESDALIFTPRAEMCLDFANTLAYRGSAPLESLHNFAELAKWCTDARVIPQSLGQKLSGWSERHPKRVVEIFAEAIRLRELIYRIFHAHAAGTKPARTDLDALNRELSKTPARVAVAMSAESFGWEVEDAKPSVELILAPVLWSAADLLIAPQRARLRECSNEKCLWLFLDDSKNGTRRWCSMQACGNRAKAHRHYLRHKGE